VAAIASQWWRRLVNAYKVKAGMCVCSVKLCDPYLSASRWDGALYKSMYIFILPYKSICPHQPSRHAGVQIAGKLVDFSMCFQHFLVGYTPEPCDHYLPWIERMYWPPNKYSIKRIRKQSLRISRNFSHAAPLSSYLTTVLAS